MNLKKICILENTRTKCSQINYSKRLILHIYESFDLKMI